MQHLNHNPTSIQLESDESKDSTTTKKAIDDCYQRLPDIFSGLSSGELTTIAGQLLVSSAKNENPNRVGLQRTPARFSKAVKHLLSGYEQTPAEVVGEGVFPSESRGVVSINEVEFYSLCEHHMLPFWGKVSVAYYPQDKIIGLSKIPRLVNLFSRRLQVQEHLTQQIGDSLNELISPRAVAVRISGQHLCMMMRGVEKQNSFTVTEANIGLEKLTNREQERLFAAIDGK